MDGVGMIIVYQGMRKHDDYVLETAVFDIEDDDILYIPLSFQPPVGPDTYQAGNE